MKLGTWQFKAVLIAAGLAACVAAGLALPKAMLWYAKRVAVGSFAKRSPTGPAATYPVLAKEVKKIPAATPAGQTVQWAGDGYRVLLPAEKFRRSPDANQPNAGRTFQGEKVKVYLLGVASKMPELKPGMRPTNPEVARYLRQTDPYQVLVDVASFTPADIAAADDHAALQKDLYLLLLRIVFETRGSEKLWQRIEVGGRRGILSGDTTCKAVIVDMYCPETKEFATLALFPTKGATMDDVYRCIGQVRIERDPTATRPAAKRAAVTLPDMP